MSTNKGSKSNPSSPTDRSRSDDTHTPHRPRPIIPPAITPPRLPPLPHMPLLRPPPGFGSHSSAFRFFPDDGMTVGGSAAGSRRVVGSSSGSPAKRGRPEKEAADEENRKKCSICSKVFASEKAVHGHMRSHRDRGWRGAHPPPTFNAEEEFADVPGVNLPVAVQQAEGGDHNGTAAEAEVAEREAEEAAAAAVERRRGIRIDLNVDITKERPADDDASDARS